jgi:hypothetical protein
MSKEKRIPRVGGRGGKKGRTPCVERGSGQAGVWDGAGPAERLGR